MGFSAGKSLGFVTRGLSSVLRDGRDGPFASRTLREIAYMIRLRGSETVIE